MKISIQVVNSQYDSWWIVDSTGLTRERLSLFATLPKPGYR